MNLTEQHARYWMARLGYMLALEDESPASGVNGSTRRNCTGCPAFGAKWTKQNLARLRPEMEKAATLIEAYETPETE